MMAEPYLTQLSKLVDQIHWPEENNVKLEPKHFFSGAALYANGNICVLFNPSGLALKLPEHQRQTLMNEKVGGAFRFFATGPIKREYILVSDSIISDESTLQELILASITFAAT